MTYFTACHSELVSESRTESVISEGILNQVQDDGGIGPETTPKATHCGGQASSG